MSGSSRLTANLISTKVQEAQDSSDPVTASFELVVFWHFQELLQAKNQSLL